MMMRLLFCPSTGMVAPQKRLYRLTFLLLGYTLIAVCVALLLVSHHHGYYTESSEKGRFAWLTHALRGERSGTISQTAAPKTLGGSQGGNATTIGTKDAMGVATTQEQQRTTIRPHSSDYILLDTNKKPDIHCGRCALVFSSGHLLHSGMGAEIDSADCVIRQNTATVLGYAKDVGRRTTVRVVGHVNLRRSLNRSPRVQEEILRNPSSRISTLYVPWLFWENINRTTDKIYKLARSLRAKYPNVQYVFQNDEQMSQMEDLFLEQTGLNRSEIETWFSTGFHSFLFALDVCESVVCYGLSDADYCKRQPKSRVYYHYYETKLLECAYTKRRETKVKGGHKFLTERRMYARWAAERNVTFRAPEWPKSAFNVTAKFSSPYLSVYRKAKADGTFDTANADSEGDNELDIMVHVRQPIFRKGGKFKHKIPTRLIKRKTQH
ncbi:alpha-N-acetyl-neuraminyl-2,3-beta-galactosyl-1,3-N-acetyl-galactosaminide alpha-2,6-sialyltransferase-like isoform X1 [Diadema antillarum]|uniref:alpha-N-acetyl-neuraminyl-2,3-beta-galactosyl-1, 3-N-acetyl-galactosaminide alpha-2,6-sialyltransferase-like isoform X1 n=1 Tax=Diadema antillarum TaxID=105358 RepID=UPI003A87EE5A